MTLKEKHVTLSLRTTSRPSNGYFLQLATVGNHHWGAGLATVAAVLFDGPDYVHTLGNLTEHDVLAVQPVGDSRGYKELRAVGVGAAVGHGEKTRSDVLLGEVLVAKFFAVDGLAAGTVLSGEVTALAHETGDHSMEGRAFVSEAFLTSAQSSEVLDSLWHSIVVHLKHNSTGWLTANGHIEKAGDRHRGYFCKFDLRL